MSCSSTINIDLANDLGNLVSRTTAMVEKYFGGTLPETRAAGEFDESLISQVSGLRDRYEAQMEKFQFQNALDEVFKCIQRANKYIDETMPWALAKDEANKPRLASVMYNLLETVRICTTLLLPVMPDTCDKIFAQRDCYQFGGSGEDTGRAGRSGRNGKKLLRMRLLLCNTRTQTTLRLTKPLLRRMP